MKPFSIVFGLLLFAQAALFGQVNYYGTFSGAGSNLTRVGRAAAIVVAATNSLCLSNADFRCTGVNDQAVIQSAIDAVWNKGYLPDNTGGNVQLLDGTYHITAPIIMRFGVGLIGQGWGTLLQLEADANMLSTDPANISGFCSVRDIQFYGHDKTGDCIYFPANGQSHVDFTFDRLLIYHFKGDGIYIESGLDYQISRCVVESNSHHHLWLNPQGATGATDVRRVYVTNCGFGSNADGSDTVTNDAVLLSGASGKLVTGIHMTGNMFANGRSNTLHLISVSDFQIAGNTIGGAGQLNPTACDAIKIEDDGVNASWGGTICANNFTNVEATSSNPRYGVSIWGLSHDITLSGNTFAGMNTNVYVAAGLVGINGDLGGNVTAPTTVTTTNLDLGYTTTTSLSAPGANKTRIYWASDVLTSSGSGGLVFYDGSNWRTLADNVIATTVASNWCVQALSTLGYARTPLVFALGAEQWDGAAFLGLGGFSQGGSGAGSGPGATSGAMSSYVRTGTTSTGYAFDYILSYNAAAGDVIAESIRISSLTGTNNTDKAWVFFGDCNTYTASYGAESAGFLWDVSNVTGDNSGASPNWLCVTRHSGSSTVVDSGLAVSTNGVAVTLSMNLTVGGTVYFFTNHVACANSATPLPTGLLDRAQLTAVNNSGALNHYVYWTHRGLAIRKANQTPWSF